LDVILHGTVVRTGVMATRVWALGRWMALIFSLMALVFFLRDDDAPNFTAGALFSLMAAIGDGLEIASAAEGIRSEGARGWGRGPRRAWPD